jgi:hypothetical protein
MTRRMEAAERRLNQNQEKNEEKGLDGVEGDLLFPPSP